MSASEKLKALGEKFPDGPNTKSVAESLIIALPQIVAVTSAAEPFRKVHPYGFRMEDIEALNAALSDLEKALDA